MLSLQAAPQRQGRADSKAASAERRSSKGTSSTTDYAAFDLEQNKNLVNDPTEMTRFAPNESQTKSPPQMAPRGLSTVLAMMTLYTRVARRVKGNSIFSKFPPSEAMLPAMGHDAITSKSCHQSFPFRQPIAGNIGQRLRRIETASP